MSFPSSASDTKIVVSIVSYGTADMVADALPALLEELTGFAQSAVLIVDNASPNADADRMAAHLDRLAAPNVRLIRSDANGGFAAGNNIAFDAIEGLGWTPDCVLLLNPDAMVRPGALREMARVMATGPKIGVVGARLDNEDGTSWVAAFHFPGVMNEFARGLGLGAAIRRWPVLIEDSDVPVRADWVSGAAMLIRREVIDEIGHMDEGYFLYFEEIDYMLQATRAGWEVWHAPDARILHVAGSATGIVDGAAKSGRTPAYWFKSWRRYFAKNHGDAYARVAAASKLAGMMLGRLQRRLRGQRAATAPGFAGEFVRRCLFASGAEGGR